MVITQSTLSGDPAFVCAVCGVPIEQNRARDKIYCSKKCQRDTPHRRAYRKSYRERHKEQYKVYDKSYRARLKERYGTTMGSLEYRAKQSVIMKERWKVPESRARLIASISGENNHFWKGGRSFEPYDAKFNNGLKKLIRERDNYTCALCGRLAFVVHHIDHNKRNSEPSNLIVLCASCHRSYHHKELMETQFALGAGKL